MVEQMTLITAIGKNENADKLLKSIIKSGSADPVDADVGLKLLRDDYQESKDMPIGLLSYDLKHLAIGTSIDDTSEKLQKLMRRLGIQSDAQNKDLDVDFSRSDLISSVKSMYQEVQDIDEKLNIIEEKTSKLQHFQIFDKLSDVDFDLAKLKDLKHFDVRLGTMQYAYEKRIAANYENISAMILKTGAYDGKTVYLIIAPQNLKPQTDNLLRSVHFEPVDILWDYMDSPQEIKRRLNEDITALNAETARLCKTADAYKTKYQSEIKKCFAHLNLEATLDTLKPQILSDGHHYVTSFWAPTSGADKLISQLTSVDKSIDISKQRADNVDDVIVPTKLFNRWLFKPFESLVNMYGTPNYNETDPTGFLAIAYMILFGAMFGDLGQGFLFWLAGFFIGKNPKRKSIGGVLKRIGLASMFFGFIYDSFFGIEELISHFMTNTFGFSALSSLFVRPLENINFVLLTSVIVGAVFLIAAYIMGIYNKLKNGDIQEGYFGKNGINGLVLFVSFLAIAVMVYFDAPSWGIRIAVTVIALSVLLLLVREPLSQRILGRLPLYHEGAGAYYMESGFELFETFLGMFSNGMSFIRVGAFALNHVGLFVAFHTIASMIGSSVGNVAMFIIGNVIVIGLEGLIVFIQGLRLVYYELFSKFYSGDGQPFVGIHLQSALKKNA